MKNKNIQIDFDLFYKLWANSESLSKEEIKSKYNKNGFDIMFLNELINSKKIPKKSFVLTPEDDPIDLSFYCYDGINLIAICMGNAKEINIDSAGAIEENKVQSFINFYQEFENLMLVVTKQIPKFKHDCNVCNFLGHFENHDLYYCKNEPTVIARFSSKGPDYSSGLVFADKDVNKHLYKAKQLAIELRAKMVEIHYKNVK
jgi:hypothetical protein